MLVIVLKPAGYYLSRRAVSCSSLLLQDINESDVYNSVQQKVVLYKDVNSERKTSTKFSSGGDSRSIQIDQ